MANAFTSAPIVLSDGGVIAADKDTIGYRPSGNGATWIIKSKKTIESDGSKLADQGKPVSPVDGRNQDHFHC